MIFQDIKGLSQPISSICLGTAEFGSSIGIRTANALMDQFVDQGGNFIDTAHVYGAWDPQGINQGSGNSEVVIGRWLKKQQNRKQIILATKGGHPHFHSRVSNLTANALLQQLDESLERLQTDYIDIYWLHRDDRSIPVDEILGWLETPSKWGLIRTIGLSNWRIDRLAKAIEFSQQNGYPMIAGSQIAWSLAESLPYRKDLFYGEELSMDAATWDFHHHTQIPLIAYSPQAQGFFAEKYDGLDFAAPDFPRPALAEKYGCALNLQRRTIAQELAKAKGCTTTEIALAWLLRQPFPSCAIIGPHNLKQLESSMKATKISLNEEDYQRLSLN